MSSWLTTFDAMFFLSVGGVLIGIIGLCFRYGYRMKCEDLTFCCGLLTIKRNAQLEQIIDAQNHNGDDSPPDTIPSNNFSLNRFSRGNSK